MLNTIHEREHRPLQTDAQRTAALANTDLYSACRERDSASGHLRMHWVNANPPRLAPCEIQQLYFKDCDGYVICFQRPGHERSAKQWLSRYGFAV